MTPFYDELERGLNYGYVTIRHPAHRTKGGEWDSLARLPRKTLRILTGYGLLTPRGLPPDVAAMHIGINLGRDMTPDEMVEWLQRIAVRAIREHRSWRTYEYHKRQARQRGYKTYFAMRNAQAIEAGYASYWHQRKALALGN